MYNLTATERVYNFELYFEDNEFFSRENYDSARINETNNNLISCSLDFKRSDFDEFKKYISYQQLEIFRTTFDTINNLSGVRIINYKFVLVIQQITFDYTEDWRISKYVQVAYIDKKNGKRVVNWDFFDVDNKDLWSVNIKNWIEGAIQFVNVKRIPSPLSNIVLAPGKPGVLFHEVGHLFEGDNFKKKIGAKYNSSFSLIDNPLLHQYNGSYKYDDEGVLAEKKYLVKNGVIQNYLGTLTEGKYAGNARRENRFSRVLPRMSITYLGGGKKSASEIITSVLEGLYVTEIGNVYVNALTEEISFTIKQSFLIKEGKIDTTKGFSGNIKIRDVDSLLEGITYVGNDTKIVTGRGFCGKKGQEVICSYGNPTVLLSFR